MKISEKKFGNPYRPKFSYEEKNLFIVEGLKFCDTWCSQLLIVYRQSKEIYIDLGIVIK
jgi:hypothetical protein